MNKETKEELLIWLMRQITGLDARAVLLQSFIAEEGPLSEEAAAKVRALLAKGVKA